MTTRSHTGFRHAEPVPAAVLRALVLLRR